LNLQEMKSIDIRTIDPATLVEASEVIVDMDLPTSQRMREVIRQTGNPYLLRHKNIAIKISFADTDVPLSSRYENYLRTL